MMGNNDQKAKKPGARVPFFMFHDNSFKMTLQPLTGWTVRSTVPAGFRSFCDGEQCNVEFKTGGCWYHDSARGVDLCASCGRKHHATGQTELIVRRFGAHETIGCGEEGCSSC